MTESTDLSTVDQNLLMLRKIANDDQNLEDIKMLTSSKVTDQLKVFLVAQARRELSRIVKLTEFLDTLESKFMAKVNERMADDSLSLKQYDEVIGTITSLLSRSNDIVTRVLKDDSLTTILNTTVYSNSDAKVTSVVTSLKDSQSRERVRVMINNVIYRLNQETQNNENLEEVSDDQT